MFGVLACCTLSVSTGHCQVMVSPALSQPERPVETKPEKKAFELRPQSQPDPLLRYRLWPAPEDRRQRAAMVAVNRSLLLVAQVPSQKKRHFLDRYDAWSELPISELPLSEAKASCEPFHTAIEVLRTGETWMDLSYDLGMDEMTFGEKIGTLLPEYQEMRDLARLLTMRARIAAREKRWDDAIDDLRLGFRLSEVASHGTNTLLSRLIGVAIAETMFQTIEEMIQIPDCPSLYWALANLPVDYLFELDKAIEYESALWNHVGAIAELDKIPDEIIGEERASYRLRQISQAYAKASEQPRQSPGQAWMRKLMSGFQVTATLDSSRQLLSESPDWKDRLDQLSDAEIVLRASELELSRIRDRWIAWSLLPPEYWDDYQDQRAAATRPPTEPITIGGRLLRQMLPAVQNVLAVGVRAKQKHHRLMTLEALRIHASESGELPATLRKLAPVPAWIDPISGNAFSYLRKSPGEAILGRTGSPRDRDNLTTAIQLKVAK